MCTTLPPFRHRPRSVVLAGAIVLVALSSSGCGEADATEGAEDLPVSVLVRAVAHLDHPDYLALSGDVIAWRTSNIGFLVPGVVDSVGPKEGDSVGEGQLLAALDDREYRLNVDMASAQRERAEDEYGRAEAMFAEKGIPENDFHKAGTARRLARTQEALAMKKLADTRLVSPMPGVVAHRGVEPGEQAGPGYPVFTLVQIDPVQVQVGVPEAEIGRVAVGQHVDISIPALGDAAFEGRVRVVGIAADPASRTYTVKIRVANPRHVLRPGMIAEVRIETARTVEALTLPGEAIVRDADGVTRVFVYAPDEKRVHARRVDAGLAFGTEIEIRDGLEGDELVVIGGQHRVREGSLVTAEQEADSATDAGTQGQGDR